MQNLTWGELTSLEQDRIGDADLADVVKEEAAAKLGVRREVRIDGGRERQREVRDPAGMIAGFVVS